MALTKRTRSVLRYTVFSILTVAVCSAVALVIAGRNKDPVLPGDTSVEGITVALARKVPDHAPLPRFRDVTEECGVDFLHFGAVRTRALPEDMGSGCALVDVDGDGDLDLFAVNFEPLDPAKKLPGARRGHALFRNLGGFRFEDVSEAAGVATPVHGIGVAAADYDRDGDIDLYVTCYGPNQLFRNRGDGTFEEVAHELGVDDPGFGAGAAFADYDLDGDLDLYVTNYVRYKDDPLLRDRVSKQGPFEVPFTINPSAYDPQPNRLYRMGSDGRFEEVASAAGVDNPYGKSLGAAFTDFDGDGYPDLYVANDVSDNAFFRNRGDGTFEDLSYRARCADYRGAMGLAVGDYDGDGDLDFFVTHWLAQENALYDNLTEGGKVLFSDVADYQGLGQIALDYVGWGTAFFEIENDGRPDLVVVNGNTLEVPGNNVELRPQEPLLFWNDAPRGFYPVAERAGGFFTRKWNARGLATGDIDRDGREDIVVIVRGGRAVVLRNETESPNHWLIVRPLRKGAPAINARVTVEAGGRRQVEVVGSQPSYLSVCALEAHFGLGPAETVERVEVVFPGGRRHELTQVAPDRVITVEDE